MIKIVIIIMVIIFTTFITTTVIVNLLIFIGSMLLDVVSPCTPLAIGS